MLSWLHIFTHQNSEKSISLFCILNSNLIKLSRWGIHSGFPKLFSIHLSKPLISLDLYSFISFKSVHIRRMFLIIHIYMLASFWELVDWRAGSINMSSFYQRSHKSKEESKQKRSNMRTIHIRIGHDNNLFIPKSFNIKAILDSASDRSNKRFNFIVRHHLLENSLFCIQNFTS